MSRFKFYRASRNGLLVSVSMLGLSSTSMATQPWVINEVFFNPPGSSDNDEYFEIRGPGTSVIPSTYWFVALENEDGPNSDPADVDFAVQLGNGTRALNGSSTSVPGYAWYGTSSEGYPGSPIANFGTQRMENSGATFVLLNVGTTGDTPVVGDNWDGNKDGTFDGDWNSGWSIIDSIGVIGETSELDNGRLYSSIVFAPGALSGAAVPSGATVINTARSELDGDDNGANPDNANAFLEIEYLGRYGDTTSSTDPDAWVAANLTDNSASGYTSGARNYGVSGNHAGTNLPESVLGDNIISPYAYGRDLTTSLAAVNGTTYTPEPATLGVGLAIGFIALRRRCRRV
jgi:hypothetical protein